MNTHKAKELIRKARTLGFVVEGVNGQGHIRLRHRDTGSVVTLSRTPGDWRHGRNAMRKLKTGATMKTLPGGMVRE